MREDFFPKYYYEIDVANVGVLDPLAEVEH